MNNRLSRDLHLAKAAYESRDPLLSRVAHNQQQPQPQPSVSSSLTLNQDEENGDEELDLDDDYTGTRLNVSDEGHFKLSSMTNRSLVKGAQRGLHIAFLVISALAGAHFSSRIIAVATSVILVCLACCEGIERFIQNYHVRQYKIREAQREYWELENYPEGECREMIELYCSNGIDPVDAKMIISKMAKYPGFFVNHMLVEELGLLPPGMDPPPAPEAFWYSVGWVCQGLLPILPFIVASLDASSRASSELLYSVSMGIFCVSTFTLGAVRGKMFNFQLWWPFNGGISLLSDVLFAFIVYACGLIVQQHE